MFTQNKKMKTRLKHIGQIPGSIIYTGEKMTAESIVQMIDYNEKEYKEKRVEDFRECTKFLRN